MRPGSPSRGIFHTPRLSGSHDARFAYRLPCPSRVIPVSPAKKDPQNVSGGAPKGSFAKVDCVPSGAISRISPVSAKLMYLLLLWLSIAMLSGVSSASATKSATVSTGSCAQGARRRRS